MGEIELELSAAMEVSRETDRPARCHTEFAWLTLDSWSRSRRVIAKAKATQGEPNPRFIVTSLGADQVVAQALYEDIYCPRGDMENRIKECQLDLMADRTSASTTRANQLRLWFASFAYVLISAPRRIGLSGSRHLYPGSSQASTCRSLTPPEQTRTSTQTETSPDPSKAPRKARHSLVPENPWSTSP